MDYLLAPGPSVDSGHIACGVVWTVDWTPCSIIQLNRLLVTSDLSPQLRGAAGRGLPPEAQVRQDCWVKSSARQFLLHSTVAVPRSVKEIQNSPTAFCQFLCLVV